jgi:hypothetical protein
MVPCSFFGNSIEEEHTEQTSNKEPKKDCNGCSPFSVRSPAHGFTLNTIYTSIEPIERDNSLSYSDYYFTSKSEYYSRLFNRPG